MEVEQFLHSVTNNPIDMLSFGFALCITDNQHLHGNNNMIFHLCIASNSDCDHFYKQLKREVLHSKLNAVLKKIKFLIRLNGIIDSYHVPV